MFELLKSFDRSRFELSLLVSEPDGHYLSQLPADVRVEALGPQRNTRDRFPLLRALRTVHRVAPDVVFATLRMALTLGLVSPAFPRRTRLVLRQANDLSADFKQLMGRSRVKHRLARRLTIAALHRADAVICQSDSMRTDLAATLDARTRLEVIWNPIDIERVAKASATPSPLKGRPALVSVGRLMPQKGYDLLLPAIAALRPSHPDLHLTIVGDGPDRESLERLCAQLDISDIVEFRGFSANPLPLVRGADLFVLASRYEGFPNAALEALACGTPVVLTDCPGANSAIVKPGMNGRLAAAPETAAMAAAIETAIAELAAYDRAAIRRDCEARFGSQKIVSTYERVLESVAHG